MCPRLALRALFFVSLLSSSLFASDLSIKVLDPQSARVAGAQVSVYRPSDGKVVALLNTDARGEASLAIPNGDYKVQVLAVGFVAGHKTITVPAQAAVEIKLRVAAQPWTVVFSATRTPTPADESGSIVETL